MTAAARPAPTPYGPASTRPPRPSATLVLVRDGEAGPEVLLVRRADRGDQNSNAWVFPGGLIDTSDAQVRAHCASLDDAGASQRLGIDEGGLDYLIAAIRETLEEAGLLLAVDADGQPLGAAAATTLAAWRERSRDLPNGQAGAALAELCSAQGWQLAVNALTQISHWITPMGLPKRFDTRFMLAAAPTGQAASVDGVEVVEHRWVQPKAVLQRDAEVKVIGPARAILHDLSAHASAAAIQAWAAALGPIKPIQPRLGRDAEGRIGPVLPGHPAFSEVGYVDPQGHGHACHAICPGEAVHLAPGLIRITARNGSVVTGPGTNTYLLCCGGECAAPGSAWVVIDPGPDDEQHVEALLRHLPGRLVAILVTHTHLDHSPAAQRLKASTGASVYGRVADHPEWQDPGFQPDVVLHGGERLSFGDDVSLRVVHTPGHASNHLCFVHEQQRLLFTGDHVMQGSTVVINPPDGDMAAYLGSLQQLAEQVDAAEGGFDWIAPGHGFLLADPPRVLDTLVRHRQWRETKVLAALRALAAQQPVPLDALLLHVYDDVSAERHPVARRSLLAHLMHLQVQRRARQSNDLWTLA